MHAAPCSQIKLHTDANNISYQYLLSLGDFSGCKLRVHLNKETHQDFEYRNLILKADGRLPHEVIFNNFKGDRFTVIWVSNQRLVPGCSRASWSRQLTTPRPFPRSIRTTTRAS